MNEKTERIIVTILIIIVILIGISLMIYGEQFGIIKTKNPNITSNISINSSEDIVIIPSIVCPGCGINIGGVISVLP